MEIEDSRLNCLIHSIVNLITKIKLNKCKDCKTCMLDIEKFREELLLSIKEETPTKGE